MKKAKWLTSIHLYQSQGITCLWLLDCKLSKGRDLILQVTGTPHTHTHTKVKQWALHVNKCWGLGQHSTRREWPQGYTPRQGLPNCHMHQPHHPTSAWFCRSRWGPRSGISNKFPAATTAACLGTTLWEPQIREKSSGLRYINDS